METTLTNEDYKNIIILIQKCNITGREATTVVILLQKIANLMQTGESLTDESQTVKESANESGTESKKKNI